MEFMRNTSIVIDLTERNKSTYLFKRCISHKVPSGKNIFLVLFVDNVLDNSLALKRYNGLTKTKLTYCNQILRDKFHWNVNQQTNIFYQLRSLLHSDTLWWHRSWSTLAQVMAWCLTAPSHYISQCWLINKLVIWLSQESDFIWGCRELNP